MQYPDYSCIGLLVRATIKDKQCKQFERKWKTFEVKVAGEMKHIAKRKGRIRSVFIFNIVLKWRGLKS